MIAKVRATLRSEAGESALLRPHHQQLDRAVTGGRLRLRPSRRDRGRREVPARWSASGEVEQLADAFLASEAVIRIAESAKGERSTTRRIWELEREPGLETPGGCGCGPTRRVPGGAVARVFAARPT